MTSVILIEGGTIRVDPEVRRRNTSNGSGRSLKVDGPVKVDGHRGRVSNRSTVGRRIKVISPRNEGGE